MNEFGARLKMLRRSHGYTQDSLASKLGVVQSAVGKYENIRGSFPSIENLIKLSDLFNVSLDYLLKGTEFISKNINSVNNSGSIVHGNQNQMGIIFGSRPDLSPEAAELLNIYNELNGKDRLKLLNIAVELDNANKSE